MGKFSRIIKHNKKSLSIDEKIKFLDKEMEKTGLNEKMTTSGMYSIVQPDPGTPQETADVPNTSNVGGVGFNQSSSGSGESGEAPSHSDLSQLKNSALNLPILDSPSGSFGVVEYGGTGAATNYGIIESGNIVKLVLGGFIAGGTRPASYYVNIYNAKLDTNKNSPGFYSDEDIESARVHASQATSVENIRIQAQKDGKEFNIPWQGYRSPQFMESLDGRTTFSHGTKGTLVLSGFSLLGMPNKYVTQPEIPPHNIVVREDDLGDSGFLPIDIDRLSPEAFKALLKRLGLWKGDGSDSDNPDDPDKTEKDSGEEDDGDDGPLVNGMTQEEVEAKFGHLDADGLAREGIIRLPDGSYREMTYAEKKVYKDKVLEEHFKKIAYSVGLSYSKVRSLFDKIDPLAKLDRIMKGDSGVKELDKLLDPVAAAFGKGIASRAFKGKFKTPANVMFRYDKWLAGGAKGRVDVTNEISSQEMKTLQNELINPGGNTPDRWVKYYMTKSSSNPNPSKTREEALSKVADDVQGRIKGVMTRGGSGLSMTFQNNVQLDKAKYIASGGKVVELTKTYKFSERTGSVKGFSDTVLGKLLMGMGVELDRFGTGGLHNAVISLLGSKYGLRTVNRQYGGKADSAPGMPMKIRISSGVSESVGSFEEYMNSTNLLTEDVKLGHFEPEALTVDIEDLRKGIVPEFPKQAPPKMIDGYSEKSKLAPKKLDGKPFIKITKKDLAKNHLLKDSDIKEFMDQINAVNEYIKKHPAELIYVQQRYPKDDKRLAALNWKMDQMLESGKEYLDTQFPENQRLVDRIKKATKKTMELTNPEAYKGLKKPDMELMSLDDHMKEKRVVSRHFKKKRQSNSMFRVDMEKVKEKNRKVAEQKVAEWQEKRRIELLNSNEFENEKSDWRRELQTEGMTTTDTFSYSIPGKGDDILHKKQTGFTGDGDINDFDHSTGIHNGGEFTGMTSFTDHDNVEDPHDLGKLVRSYSGFDSRNHRVIPTNADNLNGTGDGTGDFWPGKSGGFRGVTFRGSYNSFPYTALGGPTDENHPIEPVDVTSNTTKLNYTTPEPSEYISNKVGSCLFVGGGPGSPGVPRLASFKAVDTSEMDTLSLNWFTTGLIYNQDGETYTRDSTRFTHPGDDIFIYYWAGDKEGAQSFAPPASAYGGKSHDGWRPLHINPQGVADFNYSSIIIPHKPMKDGGGSFRGPGTEWAGYRGNTFYNSKLTIPPWARDASTRFMIVQNQITTGTSYAVWGITSLNFQRQQAMSVGVPLDDPQAVSFIRTGTPNMTAEQRKKKVIEMLRASRAYTTQKYGKDFPYRTQLESQKESQYTPAELQADIERRQAINRKQKQSAAQIARNRRGRGRSGRGFRGYQRTGRDSKGMTTRARVNPKDIIGSI